MKALHTSTTTITTEASGRIRIRSGVRSAIDKKQLPLRDASEFGLACVQPLTRTPLIVTAAWNGTIPRSARLRTVTIRSRDASEFGLACVQPLTRTKPIVNAAWNCTIPRSARLRIVTGAIITISMRKTNIENQKQYKFGKVHHVSKFSV
eukprot:126227_1